MSGQNGARRFRFHQVDVFGAAALRGNPLAVVVDADDLADADMAALANWTNLSETSFLLRPTRPGADYRVRIWTPTRELPFAGHPTLGSCQVWLDAGGQPAGDTIVQECGVGLVPLRRGGGVLSFAAPPLIRSGPLDDAMRARAAAAAGLQPEDVVDAHWVDNGPGWLALLLRSRAAVLGARPDLAGLGDLKVGLVGPWDAAVDGTDAQWEVRAFVSGYEDPVTGSLNASVAQWLIDSGRAGPGYVASQGTALGRAGRVRISAAGDEIWVGGEVRTVIEGSLTLGQSNQP